MKKDSRQTEESTRREGVGWATLLSFLVLPFGVSVCSGFVHSSSPRAFHLLCLQGLQSSACAGRSMGCV